MKKLLTVAFVFALALVMSNACFAQDAPAQDAALEIETIVVGEEGSNVQNDCCPAAMNCAPRCGLFARRACRPHFANPCNPCPPRAACAPQPMCSPCPRPACPPMPCQTAPCGFQGGDCCGYSACGPCGSGYYRTPVRNFFARIFSPRAYVGYDSYYGPQGDCFGTGY